MWLPQQTRSGIEYSRWFRLPGLPHPANPAPCGYLIIHGPSFSGNGRLNGLATFVLYSDLGGRGLVPSGNGEFLGEYLTLDEAKAAAAGHDINPRQWALLRELLRQDAAGAPATARPPARVTDGVAETLLAVDAAPAVIPTLRIGPIQPEPDGHAAAIGKLDSAIEHLREGRRVPRQASFVGNEIHNRPMDAAPLEARKCSRCQQPLTPSRSAATLCPLCALDPTAADAAASAAAAGGGA